MKKIISIFAAAALSCAAAFAQTGPFEAIKLSVNKPDGRFVKGEKIVFSGVAREEISEPLTMTVYEDGIKVKTLPVTLGAENSVIWECSYNEHKSVIVEVGTDRNRFQAVGAIVAPEEYTPGYSEPRDFVKYWDKQKAKMRKSKPVVTRTPVELEGRDAQKYEVWALEISMHEGNPVRGYLAMPKGASPKSLPIAIYAHSAGVNKPGCRASVRTALSYAKMGHGCIGLDINAHGFLNDQPQEYYDDLNEGELKNYSHRPLTVRDEYYFRLMYLRMVRAMDYLCSLPEWDGQRAVVRGGSQGGAQGVAVAGLDPRISMIVLHLPAHQDVGAQIQGRKGGWPGYDREVKADAKSTEYVLPYFDGVNFMRHVTAKVVFEAGLVDPVCPPGCVFASYNVCPSKDKSIVTFPYMAHGNTRMTADEKEVYKNTIDLPRRDAMNEYLK